MESSQSLKERFILLKSRQTDLLRSATPHPLLTEAEQRLTRLTSILSLKKEIHPESYESQLIEKEPALANKIVFELSRCEFIINQFEGKQSIQPPGDASSWIHPPLRLVLFQQLILSILFFKKALSKSKDKYRTWNMWHLIYLKNNIRISEIIKRILFKFRC